MKPLIATSIQAGEPDFARSCITIHDIDMGLAGIGISIDADACVEFASAMSAKDYRYGILDFPEINDYLLSCTVTEATAVADDFSDAISALKSAFPNVRWTIAQALRTNPYYSNKAILKKEYRSFSKSHANLIKFSKSIGEHCGWMVVDIRPESDETTISSSERSAIARARANCGMMIAALSGWSEGIHGAIGKYVWDPRSSSGYIDEQYPIDEISSHLQYYGLAGLLYCSPASVVWRVHNDNPANDAANGIVAFSDFFTFSDALQSINAECAEISLKSLVFANPDRGDPREILLDKIVDDLSGSGDINGSEHIWHRLNRSINANGYWLRREDNPPRPNPSDF